jgi:hypothetical protein
MATTRDASSTSSGPIRDRFLILFGSSRAVVTLSGVIPVQPDPLLAGHCVHVGGRPVSHRPHNHHRTPRAMQTRPRYWSHSGWRLACRLEPVAAAGSGRPGRGCQRSCRAGLRRGSACSSSSGRKFRSVGFCNWMFVLVRRKPDRKEARRSMVAVADKVRQGKQIRKCPADADVTLGLRRQPGHSRDWSLSAHVPVMARGVALRGACGSLEARVR